MGVGGGRRLKVRAASLQYLSTKLRSVSTAMSLNRMHSHAIICIPLVAGHFT